MFLEQRGITAKLLAQVPNLGCIARQIRFGLLQCRFERARINGKKQLPLFYVLPFFEMSLREHAGNLAFHRYRRISFDVADGANLNRDSLLDSGSH